MRKKWLVALLLVIALTCTGVTALAGTRQMKIEASIVYCSPDTDSLIIRADDGNYYLAAVDGTILSDGYDSIQSNSYGQYTVKSSEPDDGLPHEGIIDKDGKVIVPPVYFEAESLSDRWAVGYNCVACSEADAMYILYKSNSKEYYKVDTADLYYRGQLIGALDSGECAEVYYAYGDYICVVRPSGMRVFYNNVLEKAPGESYSSSEYDEKYEDGKWVYYHQGTGMQAFCEGCPLTEDEVENCYAQDSGVVYDLQGNVIYQVEEGKYLSYSNPPRCVEIYADEKHGVVDVVTGEEIIPMEYDSIYEYYDNEDHTDGYAAVNKDGLFGYVRRGGEVTCGFEYPFDDVNKYYGLLSYVNDPEGGVIVLSAVAGVLPERYQYVDIDSHARAFVAQNEAGQYAIIGLNGKELVPFGDYNSLDVNNDATVAVAYTSEGEYLVWTFDYQDAVVVE